MLNGHNKKDHGTALVAYIYGELDEPSRNAFESHLAGCDDCAIELAAVSDARLGVIEWRRTDFDHLVTPEIVVPMALPVVEPKRQSLFGGLVESLLSFPLFARAGVGLAAAALLVGVIYVVSARWANHDELVKQPNAPIVAPSVNDEVTGPDAPKDTVASRTIEPGVKVGEKKSESDNGKQQVASAQVRKNVPPRNIHRSTATPSDKTIAATKKAPRLNNFDEDEDKSLRLLDLFAEVGPGKK